MIQGFIGCKVLQPNSSCPINTLFWDWIFSLYPDNDASSSRFTGFNRAYTLFLTHEPRFAREYAEWIGRNEDAVVRVAEGSPPLRSLAVDIKWYCTLTQALIKEALSCVPSDVGSSWCSRSTGLRTWRGWLSSPQTRSFHAIRTRESPCTRATSTAISTDSEVSSGSRTRTICRGTSHEYSRRTR